MLPAVARFTYHGTATTYALMMNFLAAGALAGALLVGTRNVVTRQDGLLGGRRLRRRARSAAGIARTDLQIALLAMVVVGGGSVAFSASVAVGGAARGGTRDARQVLSLYQIVYQGTTPLGSVLTGWLAATAGARSGLIVGAVAALLAGAWGLFFGGTSRQVATGETGRACPSRTQRSPRPPSSTRPEEPERGASMFTRVMSG